MRKAHCFIVVTALGSLLGVVLAPTSAAAVGLGMTCGGIAGIPCDKGLWCEHATGQCRGADFAGKCVRVPEVCTKDFRPVCGCNNRTYGNDCERRSAKMQRKHNGPCRN